MIDTSLPDLSACRLWRPSARLGAAHVGIIPAWNAVTLLNPTAAAIWDLLIETRDRGNTAALYSQRFPERGSSARADVTACIDAWHARGMFHAPAVAQENLALRALQSRPPPAPGPAAFRRTFSVADVPIALEIEDPALGLVVADLLVNFDDTDRTPRHILRSSGTPDDWVLRIDGRASRIARNLPMARGQIVAELVRLAGGAAGWRATVHGAVLTGPSGPIFLAGASGAGKSTLSAGLVALGWRILAEDLAAFGDGWAVCPLPFALSIKDGAVEILTPSFPDLAAAAVHQLGPRRVRYQALPARARALHPETPRMFLDVCYTAELGDGPAKLQRLTEIEALALFMNDESYIGFERDDTGGFLDFIARTPAYRIKYGSIAAAEHAIRTRLEPHMRENTQ